MGYHEAPRSGEVDVLTTGTRSSISSPATRWDGWSPALAEKLLGETIAKQDVDRDQLTIHADNGSSMASKPVAFLLADLGVTKTHSRPPLLQRQPVLRVAVQDVEVSARVPREVRLDRGRQSVLQRVLPLVQHRPPPLRDRHAHPDRRPPRLRRRDPGPPRQRPREGLYGPPRAVPSATTQSPPALPTTAWINPPDQDEKTPPANSTTKLSK